MRASLAPNGTLRVSVPTYMPLFMVRRMLTSMRPQIRELLSKRPALVLSDGMTIGKSHSLVVKPAQTRSVRLSGQQLILHLPATQVLADADVVADVRSHIQSILRREAKHHLPHRLRYVADTHGYDYSSVRFTHASSRWGSCNQKKAISLNIALMSLPFELIDYVLVHELAHTKHLDHSVRFWNEVERGDPDYKRHRKQLKAYDPGI